MRCGYCHNPQIVKGKAQIGASKVLSFLQERKNLLDGVVFSGGEATLYKTLPCFARKVKEMGYAIKLDTNGTRPEILNDLLEGDLLDYVALDYKSPATKFSTITGIKKNSGFQKSLVRLIEQTKIPFEVRTTVHTALLDEKDINDIVDDLDDLGYNGIYYVQNFRDIDAKTLGNLPKQDRKLDTAIIKSPKNFQVEYRNF